MSTIKALQSASSLKELAPLLKQPASAVAFTLYKIPVANRYTAFTIPKKSGGVREIKAPDARLKTLQRALADMLVACRSEIEAASKSKIISHGFRKDASFITNAEQHRNRRYVLNIDLEDFFPSFNFGRVRGFFIKNNNFALNPSVATVIAQIACDGQSLPQGSPSSPIISDLLAHTLDMRMIKFVRKFKCRYSRYADDLTISTNQKQFPTEIAYQFEDNSPVWLPGDPLLDLINRAGFSLNHKKTRLQYRASRQVVTGLTVNEKVNIRSDYYRSARLMCNALFSKGVFHRHGFQPAADGTLKNGTLSQLEGILNHIYFVKDAHYHRSLKSDPEYILRRKKDGHLPDGEKREPVSARHGARLLYERFLFFKKFVALDRPLILAEGKTDNVYLRAAIKNSPAYNGVLSDSVNGQNRCLINFMTYTRITQDVLELGGSSSYFPSLISRYDAMMSRYKHQPLKHPVIIVVDNDGGGNSVFSALKSFHINISHSTKAPFYAITRNLYLVKTPEPAGGGHSCAEDLFDAATLGTLLEGKKFNKANKIDTATEYSKQVFADRVIAPNSAAINFAGFAPLLDRIVAVLDNHAARVAAGPI